MATEDQSKSSTEHFRLRQCILESLYEIFKEYPYAPVELRQLEERCRTDAKTLNWNIVYLEKCGFVELGKSIECPPYIASSAALTAKGIDLIEDEAEFEKRISGRQPGQAEDQCDPY
ncbi:MAG: hypothetical protein JRF72_21345 [Deltaproteobacteria bacterium]|jgi:hypothetical protein|nr:hypothetical protein [Deltaproteobacteria bacterium]